MPGAPNPGPVFFGDQGSIPGDGATAVNQISQDLGIFTGQESGGVVGDLGASYAASNAVGAPAAAAATPSTANGAGFGGALQDLFSYLGSKASAKAYAQAAQLAEENMQLSEEGTRIQQTLEQRQAAQVTGSQKAEYAGAGLALSGTALSIIRGSRQQSAITVAQTGVQGASNALSYYEQEQAYLQQEKQAKSAGMASLFGGLFQAFSGAGGGKYVSEGWDAVSGAIGGLFA